MLNMNLKHLLLKKAAILTPILQYLSEYRQQAQVFIIVLFFLPIKKLFSWNPEYMPDQHYTRPFTNNINYSYVCQHNQKVR